MTSTAAETITSFAQNVIVRAEHRRTKLAEAMTAENYIVDPGTFRAMLADQANAKPWRAVLARVEKGEDPLDAVRTMRKLITRQLLGGSEMTSTDPMANENARMERAGGREFLVDTDDFDA
jgi:hypothetical protein